MTPPLDPVIALRGFGFRHVGAERAAIEDVTLDIGAGEYLGVLGAAGAGATTLLTALDGVVPQLVRGETSGSITVFGRDPRVVPVRDWARHIGLVFDDPTLAATQATVADEVAFGLENLGVPPADMDLRIAMALASVGLGGLEARVPSTLSGGEQQRLGMAVALANDPAVLLADEPTSQLDAGSARAVVDLMRSASTDSGTTVVVVTHDPDVATAMGRTVTISDGRIGLQTRDGREHVVVGPDGQVHLPPDVLGVLPPGTVLAVERLPDGVRLSREEAP